MARSAGPTPSPVPRSWSNSAQNPRSVRFAFNKCAYRRRHAARRTSAWRLAIEIRPALVASSENAATSSGSRKRRAQSLAAGSPTRAGLVASRSTSSAAHSARNAACDGAPAPDPPSRSRPHEIRILAALGCVRRPLDVPSRTDGQDLRSGRGTRRRGRRVRVREPKRLGRRGRGRGTGGGGRRRRQAGPGREERRSQFGVEPRIRAAPALGRRGAACRYDRRARPGRYVPWGMVVVVVQHGRRDDPDDQPIDSVPKRGDRRLDGPVAGIQEQAPRVPERRRLAPPARGRVPKGDTRNSNRFR